MTQSSAAVAPSLLTADFGRLGEAAQVDGLHIRVNAANGVPAA
jgi:hypothetical protein